MGHPSATIGQRITVSAPPNAKPSANAGGFCYLRSAARQGKLFATRQKHPAQLRHDRTGEKTVCWMSHRAGRPAVLVSPHPVRVTAKERGELSGTADRYSRRVCRREPRASIPHRPLGVYGRNQRRSEWNPDSVTGDGSLGIRRSSRDDLSSGDRGNAGRPWRRRVAMGRRGRSGQRAERTTKLIG